MNAVGIPDSGGRFKQSHHGHAKNLRSMVWCVANPMTFPGTWAEVAMSAAGWLLWIRMRIRFHASLALIAVAAFGLIALAALAGCGTAQAEPVDVVYYYLPG